MMRGIFFVHVIIFSVRRWTPAIAAIGELLQYLQIEIVARSRTRRSPNAKLAPPG